MRNLLILAIALLAAVLMTGMGNIGGPAEGTIPKTEENVRAQLADRLGVVTDLSRFSMDGNVFLGGRRGEGQMSVFFRDLQEVSFGPVSGNDVPVELLLKSGKRVQLTVEKNSVFYGDTGAGAFRIIAGNVQRILLPK